MCCNLVFESRCWQNQNFLKFLTPSFEMAIWRQKTFIPPPKSLKSPELENELPKSVFISLIFPSWKGHFTTSSCVTKKKIQQKRHHYQKRLETVVKFTFIIIYSHCTSSVIHTISNWIQMTAYKQHTNESTPFSYFYTKFMINYHAKTHFEHHNKVLNSSFIMIVTWRTRNDC